MNKIIRKSVCTCVGVSMFAISCFVPVQASIVTGTGNTLITTSAGWGNVRVYHKAMFNTGTNNRWNAEVTSAVSSMTNTKGSGKITDQHIDTYDGHILTITLQGRVIAPNGSGASGTKSAQYLYNGSVRQAW